jgi:UDP-N-acetyl-D-galactosamine dehydrogenase
MVKNGIDVTSATVGILGVTFKENCPDIRNSKIADVIKEFEQWGLNVIVCDPWADAAEVKHEYGIDLGIVDAEHTVDALVVAVGHNEFRHMSAQELRKYAHGEKPVLTDVKSLFDRNEMVEQGFTVFRL